MKATPTTNAPVTVDLPTVCDGKEQYAFEEWAKGQRFDMTEHPLHYLFLNARTDAARDGWKAGLTYASSLAALASAPAPPWSETPEHIRDHLALLAEVELHLQSSRVFVTTREKMHPCGVGLHDELLGKVTAAIETIGRGQAHG